MKSVDLDRDFAYEHLKNEELQEVSKMFHDLALKINNLIPDSRDNSSRHKQIGLTKLWEVKNEIVAASVQLKMEQEERESIEYSTQKVINNWD